MYFKLCLQLPKEYGSILAPKDNVLLFVISQQVKSFTVQRIWKQSERNGLNKDHSLLRYVVLITRISLKNLGRESRHVIIKNIVCVFVFFFSVNF